MNLGTQTSSLVNHLMSNELTDVPQVGQGATILGWTDRHAATVIAWDGKTLTVQRDQVKRTDENGMSDAQTYAYQADTTGATYTFRRKSNGTWCEVFRGETGRFRFGSKGLALGVRDEHFDYSF